MNKTLPQAEIVPLPPGPGGGDGGGVALVGPPRPPEPGSLPFRALNVLRDRLLAEGRADRAQIIHDRFLIPATETEPCETL